MASSLSNRVFEIGISVAEPTDMNLWGVNAVHIRDAMVELARYSLAAGYSVSYGGDLMHSDFVNFSELLKEIVLRYDPNYLEEGNSKKITNYLAWHIALKISVDRKNLFSKYINLVNAPPPVEIRGSNKIRQEQIRPIHKARALSQMREFMNERINARVLLAGKYIGYSGIYPGIMEEAYLALKARKPVFLLGGFGGCTYKLIELIEKKRPKEITFEYQIGHDHAKKELIEEYNLMTNNHPEYKIAPVNYSSMIDFFEQIGIQGLNNGLSIEENQNLFKTRNIKEMLRLIFKGLSAIKINE